MSKTCSISVVRENKTSRLYVENFTENLSIANELAESISLNEITNEEEYKNAKKNRAILNKTIDAIDETRKFTVNDEIQLFVNQCNEIKKVFENRKKTLEELIKKYENVEKVKKITAVITYSNPELSEKIKTFCLENNLSLTIK